MRRQRQTALDYDRAALDAMAEPVPVAITDRDEGCLRGPASGAVVETFCHPFDILGAHLRYSARYRRVVAVRRNPSLYGWTEIFEPHVRRDCKCPDCARRFSGRIVRLFTIDKAPSWWYLEGAVIGKEAREAMEAIRYGEAAINFVAPDDGGDSFERIET